MKTITELLSLYEDFFSKLDARTHKKFNNKIVRSEAFENPTDAEIDAFALKFNAHIPDDIRMFWKLLKNTYEAAIFEGDEWQAGWDFIPLEIITRDTPMLRDLAKNYTDNSTVKKLHETGVQLTYSEPILLFDANPKTNKGSIHRLLWDGTAVADAISPDFTTFFEHWLAAGCFNVRDFNSYWDLVKDIVPIHIPLKDNLWLAYYKKQYADAVIG